MSAENFNTLKKVRITPIDPPPEFQVRYSHGIIHLLSIDMVFVFQFRIPHKRHYFDRQQFKVIHCN